MSPDPRGSPINLLPDIFDLSRVGTAEGRPDGRAAEAHTRLDIGVPRGTKEQLLAGTNADAIMKSFSRLEQICRDMGMRCVDEISVDINRG